MSETAMVSLAASLLTLAAVLILDRVDPRLALRWAKLPARLAFPVLAALVSAAGLCALPYDTPPVQASASEHLQRQLQAEPSATSESATQDDDEGGARERAAAQLRDYAARITEKKQSIVAFGSDTAAQTAPSLPDVDTMLARLVERLKSNPDDVKGWATLGWAYANTGKYAEALAAYEKAVKLDPGSNELQVAMAGVRAKASGEVAPTIAPVETPAPPSAADAGTPDADQMPMIRGMVDRLSARLETEPRNADGWLRLMKARTVLGEMDQAREALRKALTAFSDDATSRDRITQGASDLGLKAYAN